MIRKKNYLLLEILIALALFASCAVPILGQPLRLFRKALSMVEDIELERLADLAFAETYAKIYRHEWKWVELGEANNTPLKFELANLQIKTKKNKFFCPEAKHAINVICKKKSDAALLLEITVNFWKSGMKGKPQKYQYTTWIEKKSVINLPS